MRDAEKYRLDGIGGVAITETDDPVALGIAVAADLLRLAGEP